MPTMVHMIFDRTTIQAIVDAWSSDQEHPKKRRAMRVLPDLDRLAQLIEEAFIASLKRVEERPTRFALAVLPRDDDLRKQVLQGRQSEVLEFGSQIRFTADSLSKLAVACDPSLGCLLVDLAASPSSGWIIWGIAHYEPSGIGFGKGATAGISCSTQLGALRPDTLTVSSLSPGSLNIIRGDFRIGQFVMGRFLPALPTPLSKAAMGKYIASRLLDEEVDAKFAAWYFWEYKMWLEYLLAEIGKRGHGGTVIFCPEAAWPSIKGLCQGGQRISVGDLSLGEVLRTRYEEEASLRKGEGKQIEAFLSGMLGIEKCNEHMRSRLSFVAQLAVCDGALFIGEHFRPLAYGVMLPAGDWRGAVVTGQDGYGRGGEDYDLEQHGMRHRSAAAFVAANRELFGLVISQDGPVRGFAQAEDSSLLVWSDCRTSMAA